MVEQYLQTVIEKYRSNTGKDPAYLYITKNQFEKLQDELKHMCVYKSKEQKEKNYFCGIELVIC